MDAIKQNFCAVSGNLDKLLQLGEDVYDAIGGPTGGFDRSPGGQALENARGLFCSEPPRNTEPSFEEPFSGGQCPGTLYQVSADAVVNGASPIFAGQGTGPGPLEFDQGQNSPQGQFEFIRDSNGVPLTGGGTTIAPGTFKLVNISVTPISGPDDCGGPSSVPPEQYDPDDWTVVPPVTYDPPSGSPLVINPTVIYSPVQIDVDADIKVPVKVNIDPDVDIFAELNLRTGDVNYIVDLDIVPPTPVTDPTETPVVEPPVSNPVVPIEPIRGVIIGVIVNTTLIEPKFDGTELPSATAGAEFYVPRLGSISFLCSGLNIDSLAWTEDLDVKYTDQVIYCPIPWGAVAVSATSQEGVSWDISLIVAESERSLLLRSAGV